MGQRAFRGQLTDSIIKNYVNKNSTDKSTIDSIGNLSNEEVYFQGKPVNLDLEFNLDNPLNKINDFNNTLNKGLVNACVPKGGKIHTLNLIIKSQLFGEHKNYLHPNLYILFGSHFHRDILNIHIRLFNSVSNNFFNDRKIIRSILDFMCFKTIKTVDFNSRLYYHIIPEYSEFAIVLAYRDVNLEEYRESFSSILDDLLFHPYSQFEKGQENFYRCLNAIEKTVPSYVQNIILPIIQFSNLSCEYFNPMNKSYSEEEDLLFSDFCEFLSEIHLKFKIISLEIKISFNFKEGEEHLNSENFNKYCTNFIEKCTKHILQILRTFTYVFITFDFYSPFMLYDCNIPEVNMEMRNYFKVLIKKYQIYNATFAHHINYNLRNKISTLEDQFDFYDYTYFDQCLSDSILKICGIFRKSKNFKRIYKKKGILQNILQLALNLGNVLSTGRKDYSSTIVKNKKIVPFEFSRDNVMVFTN
jgi:hypothetical protein